MADLTKLKPRDRQVLAAGAAGDPVSETAGSLGVSLTRVYHLRSRIVRVLGARTWTNAVMLAAAAGVIPGTPPPADGTAVAEPAAPAPALAPAPMPDERLAAIVRTGLVLPNRGVGEWTPATHGERHLADQARMLDGMRVALVREVRRLRQRVHEVEASSGVVQVPPLSDRHRAVIEAAAVGETVPETAARLLLTRGTVHHYRHHAVREIGARNMAHAVALAVAAGQITVTPAAGGDGRG